MSGSWEGRRHAFTHDWLKHKFVPALEAWRNVMEGRAVDEELERSFLTQVLPQWEAQNPVALALVGEYSNELSPRNWIRQGPLRACEEPGLSFVAELMHQLWLFRRQVPLKVQLARRCLQEANRVYDDLLKALREHDAQPLEKIWPIIQRRFGRFETVCRRLIDAFSDFDREVSLI